MIQHPYLRAYMAGIVVPTMFLLVAMSAFTMARYVYDVPIPIERVIVFPMALIPNFWGVWNMLYVWLPRRCRVQIGLHGALLVIVIVPIGILLARVLGFEFPRHPPLAVIGPAAALAAYYLVWKYIVDFLNRLLGIA
jgi:hypothetical protein